MSDRKWIQKQKLFTNRPLSKSAPIYRELTHREYEKRLAAHYKQPGN